MGEGTTNGFSSREGLQRLYQELLQELNNYELQQSQKSWTKKFTNSAFYHHNKKSVFHWPDCVIIILMVVFLLISFYFTDDHSRYVWYVLEALILLILGVANVYMTGWDDQCKQTELVNKTKDVLRNLEECIKLNAWYPCNYLNLNSPLSPCVSVQWTFRDNELVNLPTNFLVKGDLILLRPGQEIQVHCKEVEGSTSDEAKVYVPGDIFMPTIEGEAPTTAPKGRKPLEPIPHITLETPYVKNLRLTLEDGDKKPESILHHQQFQIGSVIIQRIIVPVVFMLMFFVNMMRYFFLKDNVGHWAEMAFVLQVYAVLPLVPLVFPVLWNLLNYYGLARILTVYQKSLETSKQPESTDDLCSDDSSISMDEATEEFTWRELAINFKEILLGKSEVLPRTVSMVHALGTATAFCCVDKKGILSWPIPVAEKVFFLTPKDTGLTEEETSDDELHVETNNITKRDGKHVDIKRVDSVMDQGFYQESKVEVLDVTHDLKHPYGLLFDDPNWKNHIDSLKPLGLNILLNTCNTELADEYTKFSDHITCASYKKEDTIAVVNRRETESKLRCLCELAKQIGFADEAMNIFDLQTHLGMYKYASSDAGTHDRLYRTRSFIRHKTPMPNMISVAVKETNSGMAQLMTQGTADILLDLCSDYWNGRDLCSLTDSDRRRVLDFYHRQSMSAYCSAFSYCPLTEKISTKFKDIYIELPEEGFEINSVYRSPTPTHSWDVESLDCRVKKDSLSNVPRVHSMDSLLSQSSQLSLCDVDSCFRAQCNQIFIGMITMQYHAKGDIVQLIENLDNACIRFVHFSKENELRSRVFSEKMGLESGWNCHISLLSEKTSESSNSSQSPKHSTASENSPGFNSEDDGEKGADVRGADDESSIQIKIKEDPIDESSRRPSRADVNPDVIVTNGNGENRVVNATHETDLLLLQAAAEDEARSQATSNYTDNTDDSMAYDMLNRAKLPKGIENIRPHLQSVDNVPLLVSLFTDCTHNTTTEMIKIMQEHGEVVLVFGSSANIFNTAIFLQADLSIGVEPLYPRICVKQSPVVDVWEDEHISPMEMSNSLQSLPCSIANRRDVNISYIKLIAEARFHVQSMRNTFQTLLCFYLSLTLIQFAASVLLLPPIFTGRHLLWLICLILPALALSLMGNEIDPVVMSQAATKDKSPLSRKTVLEFLLYAAIRFIPSLAICLLSYGLSLYYICLKNPHRNCENLLTYMNSSTTASWNGWGTDYTGSYSIAQNLTVLQLVLCFTCISVSLVNVNYPTWRRPPFSNVLWCITVPSILVLQLLYACISVAIANRNSSMIGWVKDIPIASWCLVFIWPFFLLPISELIKLTEIKLAERYQKRARLQFGTKLGMNSPF
ncbi:transmembrane protein 94-like isoform X2 [Tubulanus polymorphus]|uniref:transmembrane protein 94-like isoform X2 n=1 Tax=Tubulanus polymorphus TaxID=672921 RepID=UPI003DA44599